ncbi:hypothetical protein V8E36_008710 [Tilletia maclaganii]
MASSTPGSSATSYARQQHQLLQDAEQPPAFSSRGGHSEDDDDEVDDEADEDDDDDATIGIRTPRMQATREHHLPYASAANNLSQATIIPLLLPAPAPGQHHSSTEREEPQPAQEQYTYTSLGAHQELESGTSSPRAAPASAPSPHSPRTALLPPPSPVSTSLVPPSQPSILSKAHSRLRQAVAAAFARIYPASTASGNDRDDTRPARLSSFALFTLTLALAGAQLTWTLELAYGNLFLLSLGLSKAHSALVWLAGPLSGLIAQPLVGALSDRIRDNSPWRKYRRRLFLVLSAIVLTLSTALLAFVQPCARFVVDALLHIGEGDWDPDRVQAVEGMTKFLAIFAFWILDLALNGLQAAARALILDVVPRQQQSQANAWHGRMTHAGNVLGYAAGWLDLGSTLPFLHWLGGGQFRKLAIISLVGMLISVTVTCLSTNEGLPLRRAPASEDEDEPSALWTSPPLRPATADSAKGRPDLERPAMRRRKSSRRSTRSVRRSKKRRRKQNAMLAIVSHIAASVRTLPKPLARICIVQLFAFSSWFPFLFFSTTYVVELERVAFPHQGNDKDTERGSFAMMWYAITALLAGAALPLFAVAAKRPEQRAVEGEEDQPDGVGDARRDERSVLTSADTAVDADTNGQAVAEVDSNSSGGVSGPSSSSYISFHEQQSPQAPGRARAAGEREPLLASSPRLRSPPVQGGWSSRPQRKWSSLSARLRTGLTLRTLWTMGSVLTFLILTLGTTLVSALLQDEPKKQVTAAMFLVACMGVPWAVASWVPFALLGEFLKESEEERADSLQSDSRQERAEGNAGARKRGGVQDALLDCQPLPSSSDSRRPRDSSCSTSAARLTSPRPRPRTRRQTSDLLPNEMSAGISSSDEDDATVNTSSGRGLRTLPTSETYARQLEEEELRRAAVSRRRRQELEDEQENSRDLQEEEEDSGSDLDDYDDIPGSGGSEDVQRDGSRRTGTTSAGTVLGIHNLAIVLPQFAVALVANLIFRLANDNDSEQESATGVIWVLRFGGVMALLAGVATRFVPRTRIERESARSTEE